MFHHTLSLLFTLLCIQFLIGDSIQQRRFVCPAVAKAQFPNPDDRHSFYKCDGSGNPILFRCPAKTWFNPSLEVCDWDITNSTNGNQQPSNLSGNGIGGYWVPINQGGTNGGTGSTTGQGTNGGGNPLGSNNPQPDFPSGTGNLQQPKPNNPTNGASNNAVIPFIDAKCPTNGPVYYQNPEDCSGYFKCIKGRFVLGFCKWGKYYSPETKRCGTIIPYVGCKFIYHPHD